MTPAQLLALDQIALAAVQSERATGCPAELSAAQAGIESAWLTKMSGKNNCFGIKSNPGIPGRELVTTHEWFTTAELAHFTSMGDGRTAKPTGRASATRQQYQVQDWFAAFDTLAAGFAYHGALLQRGVYEPAWEAYQQNHDLDAYVREVAKHYATDPHYAMQVLSIARQASVAAAVMKFRNATV